MAERDLKARLLFVGIVVVVVSSKNLVRKSLPLPPSSPPRTKRSSARRTPRSSFQSGDNGVGANPFFRNSEATRRTPRS